MVGIVEWLRRQDVTLETAGSNPATHPRLGVVPPSQYMRKNNTHGE
jgi:hypothetical protein